MLLYFILGILLITLFLPIIEEIMSILSAVSQFIVYYFAFKIYKIKKQMNINQQEQEQGEDNPIGFEISPAIEYQIEE